MQTSYDSARAAEPNAPIVSIELVRRNGESKGLVMMGGRAVRTVAFDMATGKPVEDWSRNGVQLGNGYFADWHQVLKRMHRGDIIGRFAGRYVDILFGIALLYLVISGVIMYVDMFRRRARMGPSTLFWK